MKNFICRLLFSLIEKINPTFEVKEGYKAKWLVASTSFTKKDVKRFQETNNYHSFRSAQRGIIESIKNDNIERIVLSARKFIKVRISQELGHTKVVSKMPIYIKEENESAE